MKIRNSYLDNKVEQKRSKCSERDDPDDHDEHESHGRCDAVFAAADDASVAVDADQSQRPNRHKAAHKTGAQRGGQKCINDE